MKVDMCNISEIIPYKKNPRVNDQCVAAVAESIRQFGFRQPIVVDETSVIVVGDTRYKAALRLGLKQVPVHVATGLSPAQIRGYRLADNKVAELADWNYDLLVEELAELQRCEFDLSVAGFSADELAGLVDYEQTEGLTDADEVPALPDAPVSRPGDLWVLGNHRLVSGDCARAADIDRLLDGAPVHLINTDPPYNVGVEPRSHNAIAAGLSSFQGPRDHQPKHLARHPRKAKPTGRKLRARDRPLSNDFVSDEEFNRMLRAWFGSIARVLQPGRCFYIWGGYANLGNYPGALKECGLYFSQCIVWDKEHPVLTRKDYMGAFELAFYGWKAGAGHRFFGPTNATDLWHVKKISPQNMVHLTEKPVELAVRAMQHSSRPGENVLDPFGGSGSTLIAAEQTGRRAFLMEIDLPYCDVIVRRWEQFTGRKAERAPGVARAFPVKRQAVHSCRGKVGGRCRQEKD
jgi:DNA modification methylase